MEYTVTPSLIPISVEARIAPLAPFFAVLSGCRSSKLGLVTPASGVSVTKRARPRAASHPPFISATDELPQVHNRLHGSICQPLMLPYHGEVPSCFAIRSILHFAAFDHFPPQRFFTTHTQHGIRHGGRSLPVFHTP